MERRTVQPAKKFTRRQFEAASLVAILSAAAGAAQPAQPAGEVSWLKEIQTAPASPSLDAPQLPSLLVDDRGAPIRTLAQWQKHRAELVRQWLGVLGVWQRPCRPPRFEVLASDRDAGVLRQLIRYESEPGVAVEAYLIRPILVTGRLPGVVVLHSTVDYTIRESAGLEGGPEAAWGLKFAQQGCVAICPRCFLWNDAQPPNYAERVAEHRRRHPRATGMAKMLFDAQRALDVLANLSEVDPGRLGAAGHSLGAKEALYLAAFDDRVKAALSSEGGISTTFSNWNAPWYLGTKQFGREHHELLGLIAPRAFLLVGGNSADGARSWPFVSAALEVYRLYGEPSRVGLFNHGQGHTIPPVAESRVYQWLRACL